MRALARVFWGHIERCEVLLHLIDGSQDDPGEAYRVVREELTAYGADLENKIEILALNKIDTLNEELIADQARQLEEAAGHKPYLISGATGAGVQQVLGTLFEAMQERRATAKANTRAIDLDETEESSGWTP